MLRHRVCQGNVRDRDSGLKGSSNFAWRRPDAPAAGPE